MKKILVTGSAGFIGSHLSRQLLKDGYIVFGIDNFAPNYSKKIKEKRIINLQKNKNFNFFPADFTNKRTLKKIFEKTQPAIVMHLGALTGVRASLEKPLLYNRVNALGTKLIYELAQEYKTDRFIFSSSSSVYGNSKQVPFKEEQPLDPKSPYAYSKKNAEDYILKLRNKKNSPKTIIIRFFSVYGPDGRPDMAPYLFTHAAFLGKPITKYGSGETARDFTFIDDIISGLIKTFELKKDFEIINLGNSSPVKLNQLIQYIEKYTEKKLTLVEKPFISAEADITYADISHAKKLLKWEPQISFSEGIQKFIAWYKTEYL